MLEAKAIELVLSNLAQEERDAAIAYLATPLAGGGSSLELPRLNIHVPRPSWLAFIDRKPDSDWGHDCRYLLIDDETGDARSYPAQFPPFRPDSPWNWRVVYRASPDTTAPAQR